jgi:hypothetical protein
MRLSVGTCGGGFGLALFLPNFVKLVLAESS